MRSSKTRRNARAVRPSCVARSRSFSWERARSSFVASVVAMSSRTFCYWGKAQDVVMRAAFLVVQLLDGFATTTDNVQGRIPLMLRGAGFAEVHELERLRTVYGTLSLYRGERPR